MDYPARDKATATEEITEEKQMMPTMSGTIKEDGIPIDLPSEEIIQALCEEIERLKKDAIIWHHLDENPEDLPKEDIPVLAMDENDVPDLVNYQQSTIDIAWWSYYHREWFSSGYFIKWAYISA